MQFFRKREPNTKEDKKLSKNFEEENKGGCVLLVSLGCSGQSSLLERLLTDKFHTKEKFDPVELKMSSGKGVIYFDASFYEGYHQAHMATLSAHLKEIKQRGCAVVLTLRADHFNKSNFQQNLVTIITYLNPLLLKLKDLKVSTMLAVTQIDKFKITKNKEILDSWKKFIVEHELYQEEDQYYFPCSAKTGKGVQECFAKAQELAKQSLEPKAEKGISWLQRLKNKV